MQTFRRLRAALLAVWFAWWSVLSPVTVHAATYSAASNLTGRAWYVPMQGTGIAGAAVVATAATALGRANPWIAAITLGMPIAEMLLEAKNGSKVAVAPANAVLPTPAGWTDSNTPPATVASSGTGAETIAATKSTNKSLFYHCDRVAGVMGPSVLASASPDEPMGACQAAGGNWPMPSYGRGKCTEPVGGSIIACAFFEDYSYSCPATQGWTLNGSSCTRSSSQCPSGYVLNGSVCTLTDSPKVQWPSDGIATVTTDATGAPMFPSDRDPDPLPLGVTVTEIQNGMQLTGLDPFGNYQFTQITPQPGGGLKVDQAVQLTAATPSAQTTTTYNSMTINNVGAVTDASTRTVIGSITNTTTSSTPATPLPDDYNREVTQKAIETELKAASAQAMPDQAQRLTDAATENKTKADAFEEQIKTGQGSDKSLWFSWVWTPPVGECSASVGSVHDVGLSLDYCGPVNLIRDVVGWLFALFGAVEVYGQLFRRQS